MNDTPPADVVEKPSRDSKLIDTWTNYYTMTGALVLGFDHASGHIIIDSANARARELIGLAKKYPRVMKLLRQAEKGGGLFAFLAGHGIMVYAILAAHDRVKPFPKLGIYDSTAYRLVEETPPMEPTYGPPINGKYPTEQPSYDGVPFDGN